MQVSMSLEDVSLTYTKKVGDGPQYIDVRLLGEWVAQAVMAGTTGVEQSMAGSDIAVR